MQEMAIQIEANRLAVHAFNTILLLAITSKAHFTHMIASMAANCSIANFTRVAKIALAEKGLHRSDDIIVLIRNTNVNMLSYLRPLIENSRTLRILVVQSYLVFLQKSLNLDYFFNSRGLLKIDFKNSGKLNDLRG